MNPDRLIAELVEEVAAANQGERNIVLFRKACTAFEYGLDVDGLIDAAVGTGLSEVEVTRTVDSASARVARQRLVQRNRDRDRDRGDEQ